MRHPPASVAIALIQGKFLPAGMGIESKVFDAADV
jgi:hypothetical protein